MLEKLENHRQSFVIQAIVKTIQAEYFIIRMAVSSIQQKPILKRPNVVARLAAPFNT